jgi:hypothetical protein
VLKDVTVRDKRTDCDRIEVGHKRDRAESHARVSYRNHLAGEGRRRNDDRIVSFGNRQGVTVNLRHQERILMDMEDVIRE